MYEHNSQMQIQVANKKYPSIFILKMNDNTYAFDCHIEY